MEIRKIKLPIQGENSAQNWSMEQFLDGHSAPCRPHDFEVASTRVSWVGNVFEPADQTPLMGGQGKGGFNTSVTGKHDAHAMSGNFAGDYIKLLVRAPDG